MRNTLKLFLTFIMFTFAINSCLAIDISKINKLVKETEENTNATISVSIKDTSSGKSVYEYNEKKLLHPASTLKVFTLYPALEALGYDYYFKTQFYKDSQNNLYIKLGGDPSLTSAQLKQAFRDIKDSGSGIFNNLYIDDSVLDKEEFAQGWMWDDDVNRFTPKVSAYNLDKNLLNAVIQKNSDNNISTYIKSGYPASLISSVKSGKNNELTLKRYNWINPEVVEISGTVSQSQTIEIPLSNIRRYFLFNTEKALDESKITIKSTMFASKLIPQNAELLTEITNPITNVLPSALQYSNNFISETIYKLSSNQQYAITGTDEKAKDIFDNFYNQQGLKTENLIIKDGCGVSRYNIIYADWMTDALNKIYKHKDFEQFKDYIAQPGEGTLSKRLLPLRGDAFLKTGTLSNISAITGYITSQDGHTYSIAILTQNFIIPNEKIKSIEDEIIKLIYNQ